MDLRATKEIFDVPAGMPLSVFENKYSRRKENGAYQNWSERITEVVDGSFDIFPSDVERLGYNQTLALARQGVLPFAGRHLQHGQVGQKQRSGEYLANCSTAMFSFMVFFLLLKNSGVGRCYDSDICYVNWDFMPEVRFVLEGPDAQGNGGHPDYVPWIESLEDARHKYDSESEHVRWFEVRDSIEGWVEMVMILETAAFHQNNKDHIFVFDFSKVRARGEPVKGQQGRPASGPVPLIEAMTQVSRIKNAGMKPWKQALFIDHHLAACVMLGGIRRSARMATKSWRDRDVIEFIDIKRGGKLYTANNSITVDAEFWQEASHPRPSHGRRIFEAATAAGYYDKTGEPGFINVDRLEFDRTGVEDITVDNVITNSSVQENLPLDHPKTKAMIEYHLGRAKKRKYPFIVNPCSEIVLSVWGGYCVIGDIAMAHARSDQDLFDAARELTRFLIRANCHEFLYKAEVQRTNRIGVGLTGIFEYAFKQHDLDFYDLIGTNNYNAGIRRRHQHFWDLIAELKATISSEAAEYCDWLRQHAGIDLPDPHTDTCIKPSGTISKVTGPLTEGAHLPPFSYYIRWVQENSHNHEKIAEMERRGYPVRDISHQYKDTVIIGYPTCLPIAELMGDDIVTMDQVSWEDQIKWLQLLEAHWLGEKGNQVSYTLKYNPEEVNFEQFRDLVLQHQPTVRCCAIMPQEDESAYAYQPEQAITKDEYVRLMAQIDPVSHEKYTDAELECEGGACPVELDVNHASAV